MHFNVEVKVRGCLCIAMMGSLWRSVPLVWHVDSRSCCNYYGPLDCARRCAILAIHSYLLAHFDSNCDTGSGRQGSLVGWHAVLVQVGSSARETWLAILQVTKCSRNKLMLGSNFRE